LSEGKERAVVGAAHLVIKERNVQLLTRNGLELGKHTREKKTKEKCHHRGSNKAFPRLPERFGFIQAFVHRTTTRTNSQVNTKTT
jgi:hypothetical protein